MNLQAEDKSNKALTVGSLNVLGGMKSDELTAIHTHLQTQDGVQSRIIADMEKLYQSISADGVITANEKQMLKKELTIIETEYPIIVSKAEAAKKEKADIDAYKQAFQKLYHYIYRELKVFDSIQTALEIERTTFNAVFAAYYSSRALLQIAQDGSTKFLPSLEITGDYENQIGTFQGRLYRWTGGKWKLLNAVMPLNPVAHYDMADVQSKTIFQHGYFESTGKYDTRLCDLSAYKGKTIQVTVSGYRKGEGGYPSLYIYDINWKWVWYTSFKFNRTSELTLKTTLTIPTAYNTIWCTLYHFPENKMNNTIVMTNLTIELLDERPLIDSSGNNNHATISGNAVKTNDIKVGQILAFNKGSLTRPPQDFIGVGKQWSHSRWIKMNGDAQDKTVNPRLWRYGAIDYCYTDIAANSGVMQSIYIVTYKTNSEVIGIAIPKVNIADDKWHNLIVCNDVQSTYARKIVYLDGKLIEDTTVNGDFTGLINDQNVDMSAGTDYVKGSLANLLFFDRLLTEQEALYLCLNPQYPVKNYSLADWAVDPANPDSSIKNLTPKYLGVTETVPPTRTVLITKGERLGAQDANAGDWVLMGKTVGGWKVGVCYRWTGSMWINLEPEYNYTEQYQAALYHICEIEELMQNTGHFGALFAKALVAQKALIDKLLVNQAFIKNLVVQKLHIDSDDTTHQDFEAWFDQAHGLKINNKGEEMLRVTPDGTLLLAKKIFFNFVQHKDIGNVLYTNSVGESCKDIFNRYGSISKTAYGYLDKDFIHKITIQKVDDANVDYWCFVHLFFGRSSRGFWYKFSIPKDKYLITFFGKDKTYTYLQIRHPAYISYPPDGTKLDGFYGSLLYNNTAAEKFHSDKRIYKTSGGGYYESAVGYIGENVTPGEIFEYDKIIEEKNPPAIVLYDDDPYKITSVMKFENIPEAKPSAPNIIWKDGEFLKIS